MAKINIFNNNFQYTASYIYSRDSKGVFHFALARKVPTGSRIRLGKNKNSGAAGTKSKYHGKWGTFGGKKDPKSKHTLDAAIREISDEAGINGLSYKNVEIVWLKKRKLKAPLTLEITTVKNGVAIFIFKMNDYNLFQTWFPTGTRGGANIVTTSHGEIDLVGSFTMDMIFYKQIEEMGFGNNFFLSYVLESFNMIVFPYIRSISKSFQKKWSHNIEYLTDINPRQVHRPRRYIEGPIGKYT